MRKAILFATSCIALVAFLGLSGQAFAVTEVHDAACDPYANAFGLQEFNVSTPDSSTEHQVSGVSGSGLACGTSITNLTTDDYVANGSGTQFVRADIKNPPGVYTTPTAGIPEGTYAGASNINLVSWGGSPGSPLIVTNVAATTKVDTNDATDDCPPEAIACYKGERTTFPQGHASIWVTEDPITGSNTLTIGEFYATIYPYYIPTGLTKINSFTLCKWVTPGNGSSCGAGAAGDVYGQTTGAASAPDCNGGAGPVGIYSVTATNRDGAKTADNNVCVVWNATNNKGGKKIEQR